MQKESDHTHVTILGERRWWIGVFFLVVIIGIVIWEFAPDTESLITDPVLLFSLITTGLLVAAPILWIAHDARRFFSGSAPLQDELFNDLRSLPREMHVYKGLQVEEYLYDYIIVTPDRLFIIETPGKAFEGAAQGKRKRIKSVVKDKARHLERYLDSKMPVSSIIAVKDKRGDLSEDNPALLTEEDVGSYIRNHDARTTKENQQRGSEVRQALDELWKA